MCLFLLLAGEETVSVRPGAVQHGGLATFLNLRDNENGGLPCFQLPSSPRSCSAVLTKSLALKQIMGHLHLSVQNSMFLDKEKFINLDNNSNLGKIL